ncbi:MAG: hypothetical protein ACK5XN_11320 [Bacteroidota bacterium]|jgi:hypothetical protein
MEAYTLIIYALIAGWFLFSAYYIYRVWSKKDTSNIVPYIYDSIPTVFTTLGVLGTFVGIYFGLQKFDVNKITESIPPLLDGMKTAFSTSIWGISLSLVTGKVSQIVLRAVEKDAPARPTDELAALQEMTQILKSSQEQNDKNFSTLNKSLIGEGDDSVATQLVKLRNQFTEIEAMQTVQVEALTGIQSALGGDGETSLLTQMQKMRAEQNDYSKENKRNIDLIITSMAENSELIRKSLMNSQSYLQKITQKRWWMS